MKKIVKIFWRLVYLAIFIVIAFIAGKFWFDGFINKKETQIIKNKYDYELELLIPYSDFFTQKINSDIDGAITDILNKKPSLLGELKLDFTIDTLFDDSNEVVEVPTSTIRIRKKILPTSYNDFFYYYLESPKFTYLLVENLGPIKNYIEDLTIDENEGKISFRLNDFYIRKTHNYYVSLLRTHAESNLKHLGIKYFYISQFKDHLKILFSSKDINNYDVDFTLDSIPEKLTCHTFDKTLGCKKEYLLEIHKILPKKIGQAKAFGVGPNEKIVSFHGDPILIDSNKVCIDFTYSDYRYPAYWSNDILSELFFSKTAFAGDVYFLKDKICIFNGFVKVKASYKANSWTRLGDPYIQDISMGHMSIDEEARQLIKEDCFGGKVKLERFNKEYDEKLEMVKNAQGNIDRNVVGEYWKHNCFGKYLITLDNLTPIAYFKVAEPYGVEERRDILDSFKNLPRYGQLDFTNLKNLNEKIFENEVNTFPLPYYQVELRKASDDSFNNSYLRLRTKERETDDYMRPFGGDKLKLLNYYIRVLFSNNT